MKWCFVHLLQMQMKMFILRGAREVMSQPIFAYLHLYCNFQICIGYKNGYRYFLIYYYEHEYEKIFEYLLNDAPSK